jgi:hypothetical protein
LLPSIPQRLLQIDETTVGEHFSLAASDFCYYVWEYTAGQRYDFSPTNQLISNLKIKPTQIGVYPRLDRHKQQAISHSAAALRSLVQRTWVEQHGTFVPMPASAMRTWHRRNSPSWPDALNGKHLSSSTKRCGAKT